jgi:hypothetical protein
MDSTSFRFFVTMPGDSRLVGAVRDLANQAGAYANLAASETGAFVQQVAAATESAIAATGVQDSPIEFRFFRSADVLRVTITWHANGADGQREVEHKTPA